MTSERIYSYEVRECAVSDHHPLFIGEAGQRTPCPRCGGVSNPAVFEAWDPIIRDEEE